MPFFQAGLRLYIPHSAEVGAELTAAVELEHACRNVGTNGFSTVAK